MDELSFATLRGMSGKTDVTDVPCPLCLGQCKTNEGRKRKCLRIWDEGEDFISYTCARCNVSGYAKPDDGSVTTAAPKVEKNPVAKKDNTAICNFLWEKSAPAIGTLAQTYLNNRKCWRACSSIRFLGPREHKGRQYPAAMVSRFGFEGDPITGVHLTKLTPAGTKFEGDGPAKITIGDTMGQPIVIHTNDEREEIVIAEGIEDTASLVNVTGWTGWAAGTANRIPAVVAVAAKRGYSQIYVAKDVDWINQHRNGRTIEAGASQHAIEQARAIAPVIPLSFGRVVGMSEHMDANKMLIRHGPDFVMAAIQWCEVQNRWDQRLLSNHQMQKEMAPLRKILSPAT